MTDLELVVGLEMHCELKSNSKVFSTGKNEYSDIANCNVAPLDMAFPGTLPVLNEKCVYDAIKMAKILNCTIADEMIFDRKNYYYPDLPKGYQITQCTKPVGINGYLDVPSNDKIIRVMISDIHLEEDTASLDHFSNMSTIDYNRAGVPLLECVTTPSIHSADDAIAFLEYMRNIYQYTNISDADTKKGQIRCDVNINLKDSNGNYVTPRVEVKNVNSFSNIYKVIKYEEERQKKEYLLNGGKDLRQETRRYDEESNTTIRMRNKEDAIDYKYFIEPNIPPYPITKELINSLKEEIPVLPLERKLNYINNYNLSSYDAEVLIKNKDVSDYFNECINLGIDPKLASNWVTVNILSELNKSNISIKDFYITPNLLKQITDNILNNTISSKQAKEIFNESIISNKEPISIINNTSKQISNKEELLSIIKNIISNNLQQKESYLNGKTNLFDYFVGQVMKETKGKANPTITKELLLEELNK